MTTEADILVSWRARPRSFVSLMGLYESNFLRLTALAGDLRCLTGTVRSQPGGDCELVLALLSGAPYTSELSMTYLLPGTGVCAFDRLPDLRLRVYHDARLVEVRGGDGGAERELHQCWPRNMMLNKWLDYCAERGHRFR